MAWRKSPVELVQIFEKVLPPRPEVRRRRMFGYPCVFANGNMFAGLFQDKLFLRLPDDRRIRFLLMEGGGYLELFEGMEMREYVTVSGQLLGDPPALRRWLERALDYAMSLPPRKGRSIRTPGRKGRKKKVKKKARKKKVKKKARKKKVKKKARKKKVKKKARKKKVKKKARKKKVRKKARKKK